jgi:hypothetical protein
MASFDIIEASGKGYRFVWIERGYLMRLAFVPFFIKLICSTLAVVLGWDHHIIRQAIVMLPSYLADGWMVSHLVRLVFLGQRWPFRPGPDPEMDRAMLEERARSISRGVSVFVLAQYALAGVSFIFFVYFSPYINNANEPPPPAVALLSVLGMLFSVWAFRLMWLYIPAALSYPLRIFLREIRGFSTSIFMFGTWLICMLPPLFICSLLLSVFAAILHVGGEAPPLLDFISNILFTLAMTCGWLVATASISYGMIHVIGRAHAPK